MDTTIKWKPGGNPPVVPNNKSGENSLWKNVTLGGATGVLLGAGAIYAHNHVNGTDNPADDIAVSANTLHVATTVKPNSSFAEAFATARAEVGPGGIFHWHGGIYNTYTAEEWHAMTDQQKHDFALQVNPEVRAGDIDTNYLTDDTPTVTVHHDPAQHTPVASTNHPADAPTEDDKPLGIVVEEGGHTIQYYGIEHTAINGQEVDVYLVRIDGQESALVDVDGDGVADIGLSDFNHNGDLDYGEVIDLHTGELIDPNGGETDGVTYADNNPGDPDLVPDADPMPDYMEGEDMINVSTDSDEVMPDDGGDMTVDC